jgi:hypothetical protein
MATLFAKSSYRWFVCILVATNLCHAGDGACGNSFELRPGVIGDRDRGALYSMNPSGGIDAIDVASGAVRWSSRAAARPLILCDGLLLAWADPAGERGTLPLAILDVSDQGHIRRRLEVDLPDEILAAIDETLGGVFVAKASRRDSDVVVEWEFREQSVGGVAPAPRPAADPLRGAYRIDLRRARAESIDPIPREAPPFRRSRRSGDDSAIRFPSADGAHLLVSRRIEAVDAIADRYLWSIHVANDPKPVAEVQMPVSASPFVVWDGLLIHEAPRSTRRVGDGWKSEPLRLRAVELGSGREVWAREIRDTRHHGPLPPLP